MEDLRVTQRNVRHEEISGDAYDRLNARRDEFVAKIDDGTATHADMMNFMLLIDSCGHETVPSSVGMEWIWGNPARFAEIVGNVDEFVHEVCVLLDLAEAEPAENTWEIQQLRYRFFRSFIGNRDLLGLLSPKMREEFVTEFYPRHGAHNNGWISAALRVGVSRETIAHAILTKLRNTEVVRGMASSIGDFVRFGTGLNDAPVHSALWSLGITRDEMSVLRPAIEADPTNGIAEVTRRLALGIVPRQDQFTGFPEFDPWWVLTNQELEEALLICAAQVPGETMTAIGHAAIAKRLDARAKERIQMAVLNSMTSLDGVSIETIERNLSLTGRVMLAMRLAAGPHEWLRTITAQFLFRIMVELDRSKREAFWVETVERLIVGTSPATLYRTWRQLKLEEPDVEITLRRNLEAANYAIGTVRRGQNPKGGTQWMVEIGRFRFVEERNQHRYFPTDGDLVVFSTNGRHLTPTVIVTTFTPVMKEVRD